jgi:nucleotide-binding universal stress UspA family protein
LSGYFWTAEDEDKMNECFIEARCLLIQEGFPEGQITLHFGVQSTEIANEILQKARALKCSTIVLSRRGLSRVKKLFLGSVSNSVITGARETTVWVVDD